MSILEDTNPNKTHSQEVSHGTTDKEERYNSVSVFKTSFWALILCTA